MNGTIKGVVLDGMKTTNGCVAQPKAHFHLKAQKRVTSDRDRSTGNTFLMVSKLCQFQGYDEKFQTSSLNGRLADIHQVLGSNALASAETQAASDVHKVRCNAAETVSKEKQDFHVEYNGGYMIQIQSKICQGTRTSF